MQIKMKSNKHYIRSLLTLLLLMCATITFAYDIAEENSAGKTIYYNYNSDSKSLTVTYNKTDKYTGSVVIPMTVWAGRVGYCSVTSIGSGAFKDCSDLTSVFIPNSVTSIGSAAFENCSGLTSVTIPNRVTTIGSDAFRGCLGLTSVTIPNSVTSIGSFAFKGTAWYDNQPDGLVYVGNVAYGYKGTMPDNTSITLKEGTVGISSAFFSCSGLTSVTIPESVTSIGSYAFGNCYKLTSVTIPNSVTSIGANAFQDCRGLTSVTIPNSVTSIDYRAFYGCRGLTSVTIPNSVTSIDSEVFYGCSGLTSVTIPNSVTSIGREAFRGCSGLTSVTIPESVTSIGYYAFRGCSGLTSVTIPESVTSIGNNAFEGCSGLQKVIVPDIKNWCSITFGSSSANPLYYAHHLYSDENTEITELVIPESVTFINDYAFYKCSGLTSVTIPNSVTSIGDKAFYGCSDLTSVKVMRKDPPFFNGNYAFIFPSSTIIYVPYDCKAKYKASYYWKDFNIRMLSDSNSDNVTNAKDYSGVASYIMGDSPEVFDAEASDVDVNGTVDVRDNVGIANIISTGSIYGGTSNNAEAAMSKGMAMPATDESDAENVIYVENVSGSKNSQVELSVRMRNASDIRGFQFDLYLPEGVSMANNAKASLSSDRLAAGDAHTLMVNEVSNGALRFLCSSMNDESFAGGDGEIATLTVNIADNIANGDYDIVVKNALMTETDISKSYKANNIKSTLTVLDQTGVETVTADNERRDGTIYTVGGQLVGKKATTSQLRKGVYIRNGRKIVVK